MTTLSTTTTNAFNFTGTVVTVTVGTAGYYQITADGAKGGSGINTSGGLGALASGDIFLQAGAKLEIVVGQQGGSGAPGGGAGGGGGGSFVIETFNGTATVNIDEVVAGGGGGGGADALQGFVGGTSEEGQAASTGANGSSHNAGYPGGAGGVGPAGGVAGFQGSSPNPNFSTGGGGGGFSGGAGGGTKSGHATNGISPGTSHFLGGAAGKGTSGTGGAGGFGGGGGGGASSGGGGGGGGYGGGGGGGLTDGFGGGGGSFVNPDAGPDPTTNATETTGGATSGGNGLIDITFVPCYCRGTLVLTGRGEVAVEDLAIGDRLVTRDGTAKPIKWIGRRSYVGWLAAGNPNVLPVCFRPGSLGDGVPRRELWVSPEHAMYLDGVLVPAELLVNGSSIVKAASVDEVEYFHLELDAHDVILAEGAWAESFVDDDSRGVFHNAAEYWALYPEAPLHPPAQYCAPRLEEGFELEALRRRLSGRARRLQPDGTAAAAAALEGNLDLVRHDRIAGWARDPAAPETPVALVVLANGAEIGRVVADRYRHDLLAAGIGDGCHAFELIVPGGLAAAWPHTIEVCRADQWTMLLGSPVVLQPVADGISGEVLDNFAA